MTLPPLRIAGVPEHFNLPWQLALENGDFEKAGLTVEWHFNKAGTGALSDALKNEEVDVAVVLTEGIVAAIGNGLKARIIKSWVTSPLIWGIHTGANSPVHDLSHTENYKIAISRYGSGSHLMALIDAERRGQPIPPGNVVVVSDLDGALRSLETNETQLFYWEKFMTKPMVDSGRLRRVGKILTPWPSFMMAAGTRALEQKADALDVMMEVITDTCRRFSHSEEAIPLLTERFGMQEEDASLWLRHTRWSTDYHISAGMLQEVQEALIRVGTLKSGLEPQSLCAPSVLIH